LRMICRFMDKNDEIIFFIKKYLELDKQRAREEEMAVLTKLIALDPRCETPYRDFYFNYYYNRGVLYGYLSQWDKAIADYTKAIEINPRHDLAWGNRGVCYSDLGNLDNAVSDVAMAVKVNPGTIHSLNLPNMYYWRVKKNMKEGRADKAIEDCNYLIANFQDNYLIKEVRKMLNEIILK